MTDNHNPPLTLEPAAAYALWAANYPPHAHNPLMLAEDIGDTAAWYRHDMVTVPDSPGLGITVDVDRVRQFSDNWWTVEA